MSSSDFNRAVSCYARADVRAFGAKGCRDAAAKFSLDRCEHLEDILGREMTYADVLSALETYRSVVTEHTSHTSHTSTN